MLETPSDHLAWRISPPALWVVFAIFALCAIPAAATQVYHSPNDDGAPAVGQPTIAEGGVQAVYLYVDGGASASAVGTACDSGQGDEVCGFAVSLSGAGGLTFDSFSPDGGADLMVNQGPAAVVINGLDPVSPSPGPQRIGVLMVNSVGGGSVVNDGGEVIGADLGSEVLSSETVAFVPEPAGMAVWACGLSLLGCLARRRAVRC